MLNRVSMTRLSHSFNELLQSVSKSLAWRIVQLLEASKVWQTFIRIRVNLRKLNLFINKHYQFGRKYSVWNTLRQQRFWTTMLIY